MRRTTGSAMAAIVALILSGCAIDHPRLPTPGGASATPGPPASPSVDPTPAPDGTVPPTGVPPVAEQEQAAAAASARFGPTGSHWPARTPRSTDASVHTVEVAPDWGAIADAIRNAPAGNVKILVAPGTLPPGHGANSSDRGVLEDVGSTGRASRILVMPRDGYGSVRGSGTIAEGDRVGYAFVNVAGVSLMGFDFSEQTVTFRNSRDSAFGWSTFGLLNVVGSKGSVDGFQLVEVVAADVDAVDGDRAAFRTGEGSSIRDVDVIGSYFAPVYKQAGSDAHSDTLQFSGRGPIVGIDIVDSVFFHSSSQILMCEQLSNLTLDNSMLLADRGTVRYPIVGDRHQIRYTNALWGGSVHAVAQDSIVVGSVSRSHQFDSVEGSVVTEPTSARVDDGGFAVSESPVTAGWLDSASPYPTPEFLTHVWAF